ncbi:hypothetical protein MKX01_002910 [Papaver californicum]|nr:hypothetical protein MKX01_002910 [Papaver californicum]
MEHVHLNIDPMQVLREAFSNTNAQGSSTACILTLTNDKEQGFARVCSIYHSPIQLHRFNYPYQLRKFFEEPSSIEVLEFKEVIIYMKIHIGLTLITSDIEKIILDTKEESTSRGGKRDPYKVAWTLAEFALKKSLDPKNPTPFAEAEKEYNSSSKGT